MPRSPFRRYSNAILFLKVSTGMLQTNEETGNQEPVYESIELRAILSPDTKDPKERPLAGLDIAELFLEGNLVEPMQFPQGVKPPLECDAVVDGQKGRLKLLAGVRSPYGVERKLGQFIQGYFRIVS